MENKKGRLSVAALWKRDSGQMAQAASIYLLRQMRDAEYENERTIFLSSAGKAGLGTARTAHHSS